MAPPKYDVAICGMGNAGQIHLGNCVQNVQINVKYIIELDMEMAEKVKEDNLLMETEVVHASQLDKVLADPSLRGVIIATVTFTHEEYVKKCIQAKKAIFCEKPIAGNLKDTVSCYEEAERADVPIFCAFNRRFDPTLSYLKKAVDNGELGKIHMIKTCSRDYPLPSEGYVKISGGIFHDCIIHDIDLTMWILNECPISVFTYAHAFHKFIADIGDVDSVSIAMKFSSGVIVQISISRYAAYGYDQRVEVFGELGMLESENQHKTAIKRSSSESISKDQIESSFRTRYSKSYVAELVHFIDVMGGALPSVRKTDVVLASLIASACEESHRTGKPIKINKVDMTFEPEC